jgi:hypothetical protein
LYTTALSVFFFLELDGKNKNALLTEILVFVSMRLQEITGTSEVHIITELYCFNAGGSYTNHCASPILVHSALPD